LPITESFPGHTGVGKFQTTKAEPHLRGGEHSDFYFPADVPDEVYGGGETLAGSRLIAAMHQACRQIAAIRRVELLQLFLTLVQFIQLPLGGTSVEVRH